MTNILKTAIRMPLIAAAILGGASAMTTTAANASEHCKKVYIEAINNTGKAIKIIDLDYYDYGSKKWRSEPTKNRVVYPGQSWSWRSRLEKVGGEKTRIRVEYRTATGKRINKWSKVQSKKSSKATCSRGSAYTVTIG